MSEDDKIVPPAKAGEESVAAILTKARGLIDEPSKWCRYADMLDENGDETANPANAVCFCVSGAVWAANDCSSKLLVSDLLNEFLPVPFNSFVEYNDHPDTTHADIMALFDRAISASLSSSQSEGTQ